MSADNSKPRLERVVVVGERAREATSYRKKLIRLGRNILFAPLPGSEIAAQKSQNGIDDYTDYYPQNRS